MNHAPESPVVVFDGLCNLCNASVRFILRHEREPRLRFASLQSNAGRALLAGRGLAADEIDTFVLIEDGDHYTCSEGALRVARHLSAPWSLTVALRVVPRPIRDALYRIIALNRFKWFGRRETCMVPLPKFRGRFLE